MSYLEKLERELGPLTEEEKNLAEGIRIMTVTPEDKVDEALESFILANQAKSRARRSQSGASMAQKARPQVETDHRQSGITASCECAAEETHGTGAMDDLAEKLGEDGIRLLRAARSEK